MEIYGCSAAFLNRTEKSQASSGTSDVNFINLMSEIAHTNTATNLPAIFASDSNELEFWAKDEEMPEKPFKFRNMDDALADIEKIIRQLKEEKR